MTVGRHALNRAFHNGLVLRLCTGAFVGTFVTLLIVLTLL